MRMYILKCNDICNNLLFLYVVLTKLGTQIKLNINPCISVYILLHLNSI